MTSNSNKVIPGLPAPTPQSTTAQINNLFMAALLWAARNNCDCKACKRLKKIAELMEESMEVQG